MSRVEIDLLTDDDDEHLVGSNGNIAHHGGVGITIPIDSDEDEVMEVTVVDLTPS